MHARVVDAAATRELRRAVLRPAWPAGSTMHGDDDPSAVHMGVFDGDEVVGACVLLPRPYPLRPAAPDAWQLRGMAVTPERQGQGAGHILLLTALIELERLGARLVWCDARITAVSFYAAHGFVAEGPEFAHEETGIVHRRMWREPPRHSTSSAG